MGAGLMADLLMKEPKTPDHDWPGKISKGASHQLKQAFRLYCAVQRIPPYSHAFTPSPRSTRVPGRKTHDPERDKTEALSRPAWVSKVVTAGRPRWPRWPQVAYSPNLIDAGYSVNQTKEKTGERGGGEGRRWRMLLGGWRASASGPTLRPDKGCSLPGGLSLDDD